MPAPYKFIFISLFPEVLKPLLDHSVLKRPIQNGFASLIFLSLRDFGTKKNHQVDAPQFGPGKGMVLMVDVVAQAIESAKKQASGPTATILLTPQGKRWNQVSAQQFLKKYQSFIFIIGHYQGFDERIRDLVDYEISIGDYILTSGELPSLVLANSLLRLIPETIKENSKIHDSFSYGRLEHPIYSIPKIFQGIEIPAVLLTGNHEKIAEWRKKHSLMKTILRRPDLFKSFPLTEIEEQIINKNKDLKAKFHKTKSEKT